MQPRDYMQTIHDCYEHCACNEGFPDTPEIKKLRTGFRYLYRKVTCEGIHAQKNDMDGRLMATLRKKLAPEEVHGDDLDALHKIVMGAYGSIMCTDEGDICHDLKQVKQWLYGILTEEDEDERKKKIQYGFRNARLLDDARADQLIT